MLDKESRRDRVKDLNESYHKSSDSADYDNRKLSGVNKDIQDVISDIDKIGVCPYCGSRLNGGTDEHCKGTV